MNYHPTAIGTIERISLPDYGITDVPAKVDTGADSSAIWASNIAEHDGELSFTLFGPTSPFYNGKVIKTRKYGFVTVKNSFGHKEVRYKVSLRLNIAGRVIRARINLANRTNNRFPVLIGRRTLHGKFVVDVAKRNQALGNHRVLMLVTNMNAANGQFANALIAQGVEVERATYSQLVFNLGGEGNRITIANTGADLSDFGLIYFRTSKVFGQDNVAAAIAQYLVNRNADFIDQAVSSSPDPDKLYQYIEMTDHGISVPPAIFMLPHLMSESYEKLVADLGLPFILKDVRGSRGEFNYLINTHAEFSRALRQSEDLKKLLIAQQFIPNNCDYRLITLGGQVSLVIKRTRKNDSTHLNNVSQGGKAELVELSSLPASLINQAVMSAKLFQLQIAGVDLMQDKVSKLWYCLEVNKAPHIYSGAFVNEKAAAFANYLNQKLLT